MELNCKLFTTGTIKGAEIVSFSKHDEMEIKPSLAS